MKKIPFIVCIAAVCLSACSTAQLPPMDDAYYTPSTQNTQNTPSTQNTQNIQNIQNNQSAPSIEYLNVQDTTVTIRIKQ